MAAEMDKNKTDMPFYLFLFFLFYLMSITRGVLAQSVEPEAYHKVLDNNHNRIEIRKCWFLRRGKNRQYPVKNLNKLNPLYDAESRN